MTCQHSKHHHVHHTSHQAAQASNISREKRPTTGATPPGKIQPPPGEGERQPKTWRLAAWDVPFFPQVTPQLKTNYPRFSDSSTRPGLTRPKVAMPCNPWCLVAAELLIQIEKLGWAACVVVWCVKKKCVTVRSATPPLRVLGELGMDRFGAGNAFVETSRARIREATLTRIRKGDDDGTLFGGWAGPEGGNRLHWAGDGSDVPTACEGVGEVHCAGLAAGAGAIGLGEGDDGDPIVGLIRLFPL